MNRRILLIVILAALAACGGKKTQSRREAPDSGAGGAAFGKDLLVPVVPVASAGVVPLDDGNAFTVIASDTAIVVEGKALVPLVAGAPDPSEMVKGAGGLKIPKLEMYSKELVQLGGGKLTGALLLFRPDATFQLFLQVMMSLKASGLTRYQIVARRDGVLMAVPIELPTAPPAGLAPAPLSIVIALTTSQVFVFSLSGTEGTIKQPAFMASGLSTDAITRAQTALIDIKRRHSDDSKIIVMVDPAVPMQLVTETLAAVRATPDGARLFPDIVISAGFQ